MREVAQSPLLVCGLVMYLPTPAAGRKGQPCSIGLLPWPRTPTAPLHLALGSSAPPPAQPES